MDDCDKITALLEEQSELTRISIETAARQAVECEKLRMAKEEEIKLSKEVLALEQIKVDALNMQTKKIDDLVQRANACLDWINEYNEDMVSVIEKLVLVLSIIFATQKQYMDKDSRTQIENLMDTIRSGLAKQDTHYTSTDVHGDMHIARDLNNRS